MSRFSTDSCVFSRSPLVGERPKKPKRDQSGKSDNGDGILKKQVIYQVLSLVLFQIYIVIAKQNDYVM